MIFLPNVKLTESLVNSAHFQIFYIILLPVNMFLVLKTRAQQPI